MRNFIPLLLSLATSGFAMQKPNCAPSVPANCNVAECNCYYCLGPVKYQGNAPTRPFTCNGDFSITVAGFYWNAHQDGMAFAIDQDGVILIVDNAATIQDPDNVAEIQETNNLANARYKTPNFQWDFGFKLGLGYNTTCDGWDVGAQWTWYRAKAFSQVEAEAEDNRILIALWSNYNGRAGVNNFAREASADWKARFNLVDLFLGREYWTSKFLSMRPFIGLRYVSIQQDYDINYKGGSYSASDSMILPSLIDQVDLSQDYRGVGPRSGLDLNWNFNCGWSLFQSLAASIIYGRFDIDHTEKGQEAQTPFNKNRLLDTTSHLRVSRPILDTELGVQWQGLFCDCQYKLTGRLSWEHHLFFHQNQLWRVERVGGTGVVGVINNTGENVFFQQRGSLSTQGWTLTLKLEF